MPRSAIWSAFLPLPAMEQAVAIALCSLASHAVAVGRRFSGWVQRGGPPRKMAARGEGGLSLVFSWFWPLTLEPEGAGGGVGLLCMVLFTIPLSCSMVCGRD